MENWSWNYRSGSRHRPTRAVQHPSIQIPKELSTTAARIVVLESGIYPARLVGTDQLPRHEGRHALQRRQSGTLIFERASFLNNLTDVDPIVKTKCEHRKSVHAA